jgi:hypothetical protein
VASGRHKQEVQQMEMAVANKDGSHEGQQSLRAAAWKRSQEGQPPEGAATRRGATRAKAERRGSRRGSRQEDDTRASSRKGHGQNRQQPSKAVARRGRVALS